MLASSRPASLRFRTLLPGSQAVPHRRRQACIRAGGQLSTRNGIVAATTAAMIGASATTRTTSSDCIRAVANDRHGRGQAVATVHEVVQIRHPCDHEHREQHSRQSSWARRTRASRPPQRVAPSDAVATETLWRSSHRDTPASRSNDAIHGCGCASQALPASIPAQDRDAAPAWNRQSMQRTGVGAVDRQTPRSEQNTPSASQDTKIAILTGNTKLIETGRTYGAVKSARICRQAVVCTHFSRALIDKSDRCGHGINYTQCAALSPSPWAPLSENAPFRVAIKQQGRRGVFLPGVLACQWNRRFGTIRATSRYS